MMNDEKKTYKKELMTGTTDFADYTDFFLILSVSSVKSVVTLLFL